MRDTVSYSRSAGLTLVEVMVATALILIVFYGLAAIYRAGFGQVDLEEHRRAATAVLQGRLDAIRRDYRYDQLPELAERDTLYVVGARRYTVAHAITPGFPEDQATTLTLNASWVENIAGSAVTRSHALTSILARGLSPVNRW